MKNIFTFLILIFIGSVAFSQNDVILSPPLEIEASLDEKEPEIFEVVERMPVFNPKVCMLVPEKERQNCSSNQMINYLSNNFKYPIAAIENEIQGKVYIKFVVDTTGKVVDVTVLKSANKILDDAAVKLISGLPNYEPGFHEGKYVNVQYVFPINFSMD